MGLLTPGYWHSTFWGKDYWHEDYWQDYGFVAPVVTTPPERTMEIPLEDRILAIQSENRTMEIPFEKRTLTIN